MVKATSPVVTPRIWVSVVAASELLGLSRQAIYARIKRRDWRENEQYKKCKGSLFINMPGVYAWIEQA